MSTEMPALRGSGDRRIVLTRELAATVVMFAVLLAAMITYNVRTTDSQAATAMQINVATHQEQLIENYVQDVILSSQGVTADPGPARDQMTATATVLLNGGQAPNPDSAGDMTSVLVGNQQPVGVSVRLPRVRDWKLRRKLQQESDLMAQLVTQGNLVLADAPTDPSYSADVLALRVDGDKAVTIATDAAYQLSTDVKGSMARLARVEVILGILSGLAAFGMALLLVRSATRQSSRFRSLVTNAFDIICVADAAGNVTYASPSTERVLGYPAVDLLGRSVLDLVHPDDRPVVVSRMAEGVAEPGATIEITGRMRHADGAWRDMEGSATNLIGDPTVRGFVLNGRDVTDAHRATADLAVARDDALGATRAKSEFLAMMSHEIRTPMNAVIGLTGLLLDTSLTSEQHEYADGVKVSAENLLVIINDILDFSKIEAGKIEIESVSLDISVVADQVGRIVAESAQTKGLELLVDCAPDVPTELLGDPVRVQQVLLNLASNAIKFTAHGEVVLRVRHVGTEHRRAMIRFEVIDTGIGVAPADQARLFAPFQQADSSTTRRFGGTGLGLAISRQLVELMGGTLGLTSAPDEGSTFWFELSLAQPDQERSAEDPPSRAALDGRRALIVDDNVTNRLILRKHFHAWGIELEEAGDGGDAIDVARRVAGEGRPFDFAILDMNMPGIDGLELARRLRSEPVTEAIMLFLLSSSGERLSASEQESRGLAGSLTKPVRVSELLDCLMTGLAGPPIPPGAPAQGGETASPSVNGRVLLVEDNPMNQRVASRILERLGHTYDIVANGRLAVEAAASSRYDAILMDCQMPEMDGYAATAAIRELEGQQRRTPIIAMTAAAMDGDREACLAAGMDDYIRKPVRPDVLGDSLRRWITTSVASRATGAGAEDASAVNDGSVAASEPTEVVEGLDPDRVATLRALDDGAGLLLAELVSQFAAQLGTSMVKLADAADRRDAATLASEAHLLKGAAANLGADTVVEIGANVERAAKDGQLESVAPLLGRLDAEINRLRSALEQLVGEPSS
jgi:two-component system, sensor histidine kinase and response regulator